MQNESATQTAAQPVSNANGTSATPAGNLARPVLSIVVPTRNESANVVALLDRVRTAVKDTTFEVIFVDDSTDKTVATIEAAKANYPFQITVIARPVERRNGLGMAVVEGMRIARGEWVAVMDGDLQHPPEVIEQLLKKAQTTGSDLVAGSRLSEGGGTDGLDWKRKLISKSLAGVSRVAFPKNLRTMTDPLTGFFVFRRSAVDSDLLQPKGFKILLEILVRCPKLKTTEVPFKFAQRHAGSSKANSREMFNLFQQMLELRFAPHQKLLRFLAVGITGLVVNSIFMYLFSNLLHIYYLLAAALSTQGSTLWNFIGTERWVFKRKNDSRKDVILRLVSFFIVNNAMLLLRGPLLVIFIDRMGMNPLTGNFLSLVIMTALRYVIADRVIWGNGTKVAPKVYYYNIHNIIKVRSAKRLPELGYFAVTEPFDNPDINVSISSNPADFKSSGSINYDEVLGAFGFSIVINQSETRTDVIASPLIGLSPHVLYTNVVEALLRWMFVRKGYALMHGATLAKDGKAVFITAQTDTGKTTTILHTLRENLGEMQFLSDDMTIVGQDGRVLNYPKPLTISLHTLRAVKAAPLTVLERLFLQVQSRLHSRGGRKAAMWLSNSSMPAATLNAIVQKVIPPPKYMVHRLIPKVTYVNEAKLSHILLIERGEDFEGKLNEEEKAKILVANAEDAYGFPPYPSLAHLVSQWHGEDLHKAETAIVTAATQGLPAIHLRRSHFDWYKKIPQFVQETGNQNVAVPVPSNA
jgi:glycosyltransferase involved in cell wall biosynthesis